MKKEIKKEVAFCDAPGCSEPANKYAYCLRCGKEYCPAHAKDLCVSYAVSARPCDFINTRIARYCRPCDGALSEAKDDLLHNALTDVRALAEEYKQFMSDYDLKAAASREVVRSLLPEEFRFMLSPRPS